MEIKMCPKCSQLNLKDSVECNFCKSDIKNRKVYNYYMRITNNNIEFIVKNNGDNSFVDFELLNFFEGYTIYKCLNKYGVMYYKNKLFLKPVYDSINFENLDQNVYDFISAEELVKRSYRGYEENNCYIIHAGTKYGLFSSGALIMDIKFDFIYKLTYYHYICISGEEVTIIFFNNNGYNVTYYRTSHWEIGKFKIPGKLTIKNLLEFLEREIPDMYKDFMILMKPDGNNYISAYYYFRGIGWDDHDLLAKVARVKFDNNFNIIDDSIDKVK